MEAMPHARRSRPRCDCQNPPRLHADGVDRGCVSLRAHTFSHASRKKGSTGGSTSLSDFRATSAAATAATASSARCAGGPAPSGAARPCASPMASSSGRTSTISAFAVVKSWLPCLHCSDAVNSRVSYPRPRAAQMIASSQASGSPLVQPRRKRK